MKNKVLELFELNRGEFISGEEIGSRLGVSRNTIWKSVGELKNMGYKIDSVNKKGYLFREDNDLLSVPGIKPFVSFPGASISFYDELESTNTAAKQAALSGVGHGNVIIADRQISGKGRHGRSFYSPKGTGIYMSLIIDPKQLNFSNITVITSYVAVMVALGIENVTGIKPDVKWVNDLFINGKKIVGISTEGITDYESGNVHFIVTGIGINVSTRNFPDDVPATSLYPDGKPLATRNHLAGDIISNIYNNLTLEQDYIMSEYKKRLFILGKDITVHAGGISYTGTAVDIDNEGHLLVAKNTGETVMLNHGEVSLTV